MGELEVGFTVAFVVTMLVALVGNTLLIYIVWKKPETRTLTSFMFVNLAVADLLTTLLQMPITISFFLEARWIPGQAGKITCKCFYYAAFTSITASILSLTVIAVDRFFVVHYPFRTIAWFRKAKIIAPVIWVLSLALMAVSVTAITLNEGIKMCSYNFPEAAMDEKSFWIYFFIVNYLVPLIIISVLYGAIIRKLWSHKVPSDAEGQNNPEEQQRKRELVRMLVIIVVVFALCWLPVNVFQLEHAYGVKEGKTSFPPFIMYLCFLLSQGNSAINPWLYMGLNRKFSRFLACTCAAAEERREQQREEVKLQRKALRKEAERENSDSFGDKL
ncbi:hypothetical protein ACROYT_G033628 [Oculina patagonica]